MPAVELTRAAFGYFFYNVIDQAGGGYTLYSLSGAPREATLKPCAPVMDAIKDCSKPAGLVLDPFGGSGTTMMAAHKTRRRARLLELDPVYVDLTFRRWQALTGARPAMRSRARPSIK